MPLRSKAGYRLTLMDKINVCLQDFGDHVMHLVFDVPGMMDAARLNRAVRLSLIAHPVMAQRLIPGGWYPRWLPWDEDQLNQFVYCETETLAEGANSDAAIQKYLISEMDFQQRPMVHTRLIRSNQDTLCIKVSCLPIDGRGFILYVETLLAIYNILKEEPDFIPQPGTLGDRSTKSLVPLFSVFDGVKLLFAALRNQLTDAFTARNWQFPVRQHEQISKRYHYHQFQPATMAAIHTYRAQHGLTLNDIILGAYYKALYDMIEPEESRPFCVLNTYDLRRYEGPTGPARVANYSSFINTNVILNSSSSMADAARGVSRAMAKRKSRYPGITEGPFIWPIMTLLPFAVSKRLVSALLKHRGECIPVLTNVGKIDLSRLQVDNMRLSNVRPFAPLEYPPKLTVTVASADNLLCLSVGYSSNHMPTPLIEELFQRMENLIIETCGNVAPATTRENSNAPRPVKASSTSGTVA